MEDPEIGLDTKVREELGSIRTSWARRGARPSLIRRVRRRRGHSAPAVSADQRHGRVRRGPVLSLHRALPGRRGRQPLTGRTLLFSGTRQVAIGAAAAAVTYAVGTLIGANVA